MKKKGFLVTIASPSGGGKTTICRELLSVNKTLSYSISWTTRPLRGMEKNGKDYFFTDIDTFKAKIEEGYFLEYALVHGNYYGTSIEYIEESLNDGSIVLLDIDVQGVDLLKNSSFDVVSIFLLPPNEEVLKERLISRKTDSENSIFTRLENSKKEINHLFSYDYLVINDDLEKTVETVNNILTAEYNKVKRYVDPLSTFY
jgi:guanylate kinase